MTLTPTWQRAWDLGAALARDYSDEQSALYSLDMADLEEMATTVGFEQFFHAGFTGRVPEWVEAIRFGEIPASGRSINWADHSWEPGVSCVRIIRKPEDADAVSLYDVTLGWQGQEKIRVAGWWLGLTGSDGEPTLLGCVKL